MRALPEVLTDTKDNMLAFGIIQEGNEIRITWVSVQDWCRQLAYLVKLPVYIQTIEYLMRHARRGFASSEVSDG